MGTQWKNCWRSPLSFTTLWRPKAWRALNKQRKTSASSSLILAPRWGQCRACSERWNVYFSDSELEYSNTGALLSLLPDWGPFVSFELISRHCFLIFQKLNLFGPVGSQVWHRGSSLWQAGSVVVGHGLSSCGTWAPELVGSVAARG